MKMSNEELYEIKEFIAAGRTFNVFNHTDATALVEALEELYMDVMITVEECHNGDVFGLSLAVKVNYTIEDYLEESGEVEVVKNVTTYDVDGTQIDYDSEILKTFKTMKGAENYASKQGFTVSYL